VLSSGAASALGGGLAVEGGTLILSGSQGFAGGAAITGGRLLVNGDAATALGGVTVAGGTLGGTGVLGGAVTVGAGGVVAPGDGIESLVVGAVTFQNGSALVADVSPLALAADLLVVGGDLALAGTVGLTVVDPTATGSLVPRGTTFTLVNYTGAWNGGLFTVGGGVVANGGWFTAAGNTWQIDYAASSGGSNFTADQTSGRFVTITAVPEPGGIALAAAGIALAAWRVAVRRRGRRSTGITLQPAPPPGG
jgi:hypothetical protein